MLRLAGQVALVTGSSSGVGEAIAMALAMEGASVALVARREEVLQDVARKIRERGGAAEPFPADVSDSASVQTMAEAVLRSFGRLDILVNNAGVNLPQRSFDDVTLDGWKTMIDLNLSGPFYCTQAFLPAMRAQGKGTIVNIASWSGKRAMLRTGPAYCSSKAGLVSLNESINLAERVHGIRSCVICPGEVNTPILKKRPQPLSEAALATMLQPEDVASAALFVVTLPERATIEELVIRPTILRNPTDNPTMEANVDPTAVRP